MRKSKYSYLFRKQLRKLKGRELQNILNKIDEILATKDLDHYKNLKYELKKYKRVHVNNSYVVLFFGDDGFVYFVDYAHHDLIYEKKYSDLRF